MPMARSATAAPSGIAPDDGRARALVRGRAGAARPREARGAGASRRPPPRPPDCRARARPRDPQRPFPRPPRSRGCAASGSWAARRSGVPARDVLSVTISDAEASRAGPCPRTPRWTFCGPRWPGLDLGVRAARRRLLRERAATFDQSPRAPPPARHANALSQRRAGAGDVVRTGLPATLEGAVISGRMAARGRWLRSG
jgi:hypothetical protein